ncbi:hypothetical protein [Candidatus Hodarchaeum mangrovi]
MKDKWRVTPKRIGRSRKIQVRQFEPEEIFIEYDIEVYDDTLKQDAIREATQMAIQYLDEEEARLRGKSIESRPTEEKIRIKEYSLEILPEGKKLGNFKVKTSEDPQFSNYLHLWLEKGQENIYVGYLLKDSGNFKFKSENKAKIKEIGIKKDIHFKIKEKE